MQKAIVLLSGGLDSTTCLAIAKNAGYECHTLTFHYGQKHEAELLAAKKIADYYQATPHTIHLPAYQFATSSLVNQDIPVANFNANQTTIPSTYVPARNTIFLAHALALAEVVGAQHIFIGVSAIDYSGYPDCRPEFIAAFQAVADLATKTSIENQPIKIHTPLIHLSKAETIKLGHELGVNYTLTVTCYRATDAGEACGTCESCVLRKNGFAAAGVSDPTLYGS